MTPTRRRVLDAAVELLAAGGTRSLTHARVDRHAELPGGSTSNYFRTRRALVSGVVDALVERDQAEVDQAFAPASPEELVAGLCALLDRITRLDRRLTTARLVLFVEASHDADLRAALSRGHETLGATVVVAMARLGARDPQVAAATIAACFEGLMLHRIARHDESDPEPIFALAVQAALV